MKKLKLKQKVIDAFGIAMFFLIIIVGVMVLDIRNSQLEQQKSTECGQTTCAIKKR